MPFKKQPRLLQIWEYIGQEDLSFPVTWGPHPLYPQSQASPSIFQASVQVSFLTLPVSLPSHQPSLAP